MNKKERMLTVMDGTPMNKRQRVLNAMNNQPVDRPPVGFWFHFQAGQGMGDACVQAHLDYYHDVDLDFIKIMSDGLNYPIRATITCAADWRKVEPLAHDDPFFT
ncbi:MAG: hypothetical protein RSH26_07745, partial [Clostridia bacterium]